MIDDIEKKTTSGELQQVITDLPEFVWIPQFLSLGGSVVYGKDKPNDIDVIVRATDNKDEFIISLDKSLRLKIDRILEETIGKPSDNWNGIDWIATTYGPNWKYCPLYDLVLRPIKDMKLVSVGEPDFENKFYKDATDTMQIIDEKLKEPEKNKMALIADLRYLGNSAYPSILQGESWGGWTRDDLVRYYAKIVNILRSIGMDLTPPMIGSKEYSTSYWKCYREAKSKKYLEPEGRKVEILKPRDIRVFAKQGEEQIVYGVVYAPNEEDAQGDMAEAIEIQKACHYYMENSRHVKVFHKGNPIKFNILENFISPTDFTMTATDGSGQYIPKGSWVMSGRVLSKEVWEDVKMGRITGFSMAGVAQRL